MCFTDADTVHYEKNATLAPWWVPGTVFTRYIPVAIVVVQAWDWQDHTHPTPSAFPFSTERVDSIFSSSFLDVCGCVLRLATQPRPTPDVVR